MGEKGRALAFDFGACFLFRFLFGLWAFAFLVGLIFGGPQLRMTCGALIPFLWVVRIASLYKKMRQQILGVLGAPWQRFGD